MLDKMENNSFARITVIETVGFCQNVYMGWAKNIVDVYYYDLMIKKEKFEKWLESYGVYIITHKDEMFLYSKNEQDMTVFMLKQPWTEKQNGT